MRKITLIISYSLLVLSYSVKAQTITTIAGIGTGGYSGDGFAATSAELNEAVALAIDKAGNIYIADAVNNRIRRVDASTGIITTIAGTGTAGYNGDGIAATSAELYYPWGLAFDTAGNLYIGDCWNSRVRKITISTGIITTVAGNGTFGYNGDGILATSAELNYPVGVYVDKKGNLYFGDVDNQRVRKVNTAGYISTVAGTGTAGYNGDGIAATAAELHNPNSVRLDSAGNIYIADYYNNEIRRIDVSTGLISSIAGSGNQGFSGDGGLATSAELYYPTGVSIDAKGNVYLADLLNQRIREVDASTGIITTVAGNGTAGYSGDGGPATSAEFNGPWDVLVTTNAFYIGEQIGNRGRKVTLPSTEGIEEVANGINVTAYPNPVSDNLYVHVEGTNGNINLSLFNTLGQQILEKNSDEKNNTISVTGISSGIYFLQILTQDGNISMQKISIIR